MSYIGRVSNPYICLLHALLLINHFVLERDNSSVGEEESFEWRHVRSALLDWQVWSVSFIYVTICVPSECYECSVSPELS